jgi:DNA-binding PadR family transcriptional regulator
MPGRRLLGSQLQKGTTPLLVLTVIGDGELYGYEIARQIRDRSGARSPRRRARSTRPSTGSSRTAP